MMDQPSLLRGELSYLLKSGVNAADIRLVSRAAVIYISLVDADQRNAIGAILQQGTSSHLKLTTRD